MVGRNKADALIFKAGLYATLTYMLVWKAYLLSNTEHLHLVRNNFSNMRLFHTLLPCLHSLMACDPVCQVSWKEGGKLVAADWPARGQLLPCHQACALETEGYHQATVHST